MDQVKLLSLTAVLTVLIWMAADSLVTETATVTVAIDLLPATAEPAMVIETPDGRPVCELDVSGPRRVVEGIAKQAQLGARLRVADRETGVSQLPLERESLERALSERYRDFRRLAILAVRPASLKLNVDHIVEQSVALTAKRLTQPYEAEPSLDRTTVTVRLRESRYRALAASGEPIALDLSVEIDRLFRDKSVAENEPIPLVLDPAAFGSDAVANPRTVRVTAAVKARRSIQEVPTVPVLVAVSFANLEKSYRAVTLDDVPIELVARTIRVAGPSEQVARLVRGDTRAFGVLRLKEDDFRNLGSPKLLVPEYYLPPGVELVGSPEPVEFRLVAVPGDGG